MRIEWTMDNRPIWGTPWTPQEVAGMVGADVPITDGLNRNELGSAHVVEAQVRGDFIWLTLDVEGEKAMRAMRSPLAASVTTPNPNTLREFYGDPDLSIDAILEE